MTHSTGFKDPPYAGNTDPQQVRPLREYPAATFVTLAMIQLAKQ